MAERLWDAVSSTLADTNGVSSSDTEITVEDASEFPNTGNFRIGVEDEQMLVTAVAGNVFTVTRGIEPSVAMAHAKGVIVATILSKAGLETYISENAGGGSGLGWTYESAWDSGTAYVVDDVVTHNGSCWLCLQGDTGTEPGTSGAVWGLLASKGDQGDPGSSGSPAFHGCRLTSSSDQHVSTGGMVAILFDGESYDTDAYHSTSSNTSRITIPTGLGGYYLLQAQLVLSAFTGDNIAAFKKNGSVDLLYVNDTVNAGIGRMCLSHVCHLDAGDYVELKYNPSTGSSDSLHASDYAPIFSATLLGQ